MRLALLIFIVVHGLIHTLSKPTDLLWLVATVLFISFGILHFTNTRYAWAIGFIAVLVSQILIITFWKDAKFGTLPNLLILLVSIVSYGYHSFQELVQLETKDILHQSNLSDGAVVSENDISGLPLTVKNWLRRSGAVGKPFIRVGKVIQRAEMKLKPEQENWYPATAIQYSTIDVPAFIWVVDVKINEVLKFQGRDKFEKGKGEMLIKLNALINVVNEKGKKLDEGSLQRYLGEMAWFPSLALSPYITWKEVNDTTATAIMDYQGTRGSGTFYFNADGDFIKFSALRYKGNKANDKKYAWVLLVQEHKSFAGIRIPSKMTATWKLENEDWTWLRLEIEDMSYHRSI